MVGHHALPVFTTRAFRQLTMQLGTWFTVVSRRVPSWTYVRKPKCPYVHVPKCLGFHKVIVGITGKTHWFHDLTFTYTYYWKGIFRQIRKTSPKPSRFIWYIHRLNDIKNYRQLHPTPLALNLSFFKPCLPFTFFTPPLFPLSPSSNPRHPAPFFPK